jgi:hypothetical protein
VGGVQDDAGDVDEAGVVEPVQHGFVQRVELGDDAEAWEELGYRLVLEYELVFHTSFAALPRLVRLASRSARAHGLAGTILRVRGRTLRL